MEDGKGGSGTAENTEPERVYKNLDDFLETGIRI
jgi:hypothetical protein